MRVLLCLLLVACGPKVTPKASAFDEDLPSRTSEPTTAEVPEVEQQRPEAPPGKGLRTGTIERAKLIAVLDGGPGAFLRQLEITPRMQGERFVGWQLVQLLDRGGPLYDVDVAPGDVLLAVNGRPLSRPDQLQQIWDSLRTANELRAHLWRGDAKVELAFAIEPKVDPSMLPPKSATKPAKPEPMPAPRTEPAKSEPAKSEPVKQEPLPANKKVQLGK